MRGATPLTGIMVVVKGVFQLTRPMRGATRTARAETGVVKFQLTRPMRGATHKIKKMDGWYYISTHTPHAGRDPTGHLFFQIADNFNSHAPCGARPHLRTMPTRTTLFQLTRPMRGATTTDYRDKCILTNFNSHAPCGARQRPQQDIFDLLISTHTPHAGRDA